MTGYGTPVSVIGSGSGGCVLVYWCLASHMRWLGARVDLYGTILSGRFSLFPRGVGNFILYENLTYSRIACCSAVLGEELSFGRAIRKLSQVCQ